MVPPSGELTTPQTSYFERIQAHSPSPISTSTRPTTLFQRIAYPVMSLLPRLRRNYKRRDDTDGLIAPVRAKTPLGSPTPSPRGSPPTLPPASPGWMMMPPPSPSASRNGHSHEGQALGINVGYGRATPPFLQPPPLRRATTDSVSSSALSPRRLKFNASNGVAHGDSLHVPGANGSASGVASENTGRISVAGRRRLATTGEDVFD